MAKKFIEGTELVEPGYANGISTQLFNKQRIEGQEARLTEIEKEDIIEKAAHKFGLFLDELGCEWRRDPNSSDTPKRVAKAYVNDLWRGRYEPLDKITAFPSDGYDGIVQESNIPVQ